MREMPWKLTRGTEPKTFWKVAKKKEESKITWITLDHPDILVSLNIHPPH
jgi:hypothetical protein